MSKKPEPNPGVLKIIAYVPGKSAAPDGIKLAKLSSNESPLGPSQNAVNSLGQVIQNLHEYPDPTARQLREAIAETHGLNPDNIVCGAGSDELLSLIANAYLSKGDEAVYSQHGFLMYPIIISATGAKAVVAREIDCVANVDAILSCIGERTKIVFLANPNNPTGTYLPIEEVRRLHAALPSNVVLVIDAAYAEYVQRNDYESGIELVSGNDNVIMTRTFSKIYGLAALRIGWAYASAGIIDVLNRIRGPFNVNSSAIIAGAAAMRDSFHVQSAIAHNNKWLPWVSNELTKIGLKVTPSVGNFILIHFPDNKRSAEAADIALTKQGYILRAVTGYGFPNALRMTIGNEEENIAVVKILTGFMKGELA
ncbi:MAG: histidinol-phosphate transaminase [Hyphomicrobiales bacterium]|nr:histidinol-phosphate transaminase [Hyphomicrobiales bacterium]